MEVKETLVFNRIQTTNLSIEEIADITGLSIDEVKLLAENKSA